MKLEKIRPWGRSKEDYEKMFGLGSWPQRILSVGDGPASFQAEMKGKHQVISLDPIYTFAKDEIERVIQDSRTEIVRQLELNHGEYDWSHYRDLPNLVATRMHSMNLFLTDYEEGRREGRYIHGSADHLPFTDDSFDLALSSHFLFLYADHLDQDFHQRALEEMLRVAKEVRIYPLVDLDCRPSKHIEPLVTFLMGMGVEVREIEVAYRFQRGATRCLVLRKA